MELKNRYFLIRHGQAESNVKNICSCFPETFENHLTPEGRQQVEKSAELLKEKHIDLIFASDLLRTKETAEIIAKALNIVPEFDTRLREYNFGVWNGRLIEEFNKEFPDVESRFVREPEGGENYYQISDRMYDFLQDMESRYNGKQIVVVSHEVPLALLLCKAQHLTPEETFKAYFTREKIKNAEIKEL